MVFYFSVENLVEDVRILFKSESKILIFFIRFFVLKWGIIFRFFRSCAIFFRIRVFFFCWKCSMSFCIIFWGIWLFLIRFFLNFSSCCNVCWELDIFRRFIWIFFVGGFCISFSFLIGFGFFWDEFSYRSYVNLCI